jgi:hypothetical protein
VETLPYVTELLSTLYWANDSRALRSLLYRAYQRHEP